MESVLQQVYQNAASGLNQGSYHSDKNSGIHKPTLQCFWALGGIRANSKASCGIHFINKYATTYRPLPAAISGRSNCCVHIGLILYKNPRFKFTVTDSPLGGLTFCPIGQIHRIKLPLPCDYVIF